MNESSLMNGETHDESQTLYRLFTACGKERRRAGRSSSKSDAGARRN